MLSSQVENPLDWLDNQTEQDKTMTVPMEHSEHFVQLLLDDGLIRRDDWQIAQSIHKVQGGRLIEILLGLCPISEEDLYQAIARQLTLPFWSEHELTSIALDPNLLHQFPAQVVLEYSFLPIKSETHNNQVTLHLVVPDPLIHETLDSIRAYGQASYLQLGIATPSAITNAIQIHYKHRMNLPDTQPKGRPGSNREERAQDLPISQTSHGIAPPKLQMRECPACENVQPLDLSHCNKCGSPMDLTQADPILGKNVGHFLLQSKLGEGGMGLVYQALNTHNNQEAAVKILRTHLTTNERVVKRFHREAQAQNHLRHDNIVFVHDFGFEEGIGFYIAMEFLRGKSMEEILEDNPEMLSIKFTQSIIRQVCDAMGFAHSRGIYHRDLKPDNIFLMDQGRWDPSAEQSVKVLDFGVAKMVASEEDERLTRTGMTIGTPRYMAPEQAGDGNADHRSDIYSLGVILFEILTGQSPFEGSSAYQIMLRHVYADPPSLRETRPDIPYPASLESFVQRTMAKDPQHRPASMDMFWQELEPCLQQLEQLIDPTASMHNSARGSFRRNQTPVDNAPETVEPPVIVGRMVQPTGPSSSPPPTNPPATTVPVQAPAMAASPHASSASSASWLGEDDLAFWEDSVQTNLGDHHAKTTPSASSLPAPAGRERSVASTERQNRNALQSQEAVEPHSIPFPGFASSPPQAPHTPPPPSQSVRSSMIPTKAPSTGSHSAGPLSTGPNHPTKSRSIGPSRLSSPRSNRSSSLNIKRGSRDKPRQVKPRALKKKPQSGSKFLFFFFLLIIFGTIGVGTWYYLTQMS